MRDRNINELTCLQIQIIYMIVWMGLQIIGLEPFMVMVFYVVGTIWNLSLYHREKKKHKYIQAGEEKKKEE